MMKPTQWQQTYHCSLVHVMEAINQEIARYQPFWNKLEEVDRLGSEWVSEKVSVGARYVRLTPRAKMFVEISVEQVNSNPKNVRFDFADRNHEDAQHTVACWDKNKHLW